MSEQIHRQLIEYYEVYKETDALYSAVAERSGAEAFYAGMEQGLEALEGLDGCEGFTLLRLDADNTGATVE